MTDNSDAAKHRLTKQVQKILQLAQTKKGCKFTKDDVIQTLYGQSDFKDLSPRMQSSLSNNANKAISRARLALQKKYDLEDTSLFHFDQDTQTWHLLH